MSTYSRALRHINMVDVKKKHQQKIIEEKQQKKLEREEKKYIQSVMKEIKYDWRKELNEGMTSSGVFFTTLNPPENTYDNPIVTTTTTTISSVNAINSTTRLITLGSYDVSAINQFEVNATKLSPGTSWGWVLQANGTGIAAGGENDPIRVANASQLALFKSGRVTLTIRQSFIGDNAFDPSVGGWSINNVKFYRTVPMNVFVSLDSPEATAFIRTEPNLSDLSPEEKNKKLTEMLNASDEYLEKMLGADFPGTGAVPPGEYDPFAQPAPGEAGDTPGVDIDNWIASDYEKSGTAGYGNPYRIDWGPKPGKPGPGYKDPNQKWDDNDPSTWPSIKNQVKQASDDQNKKKKDSVVVAHYEPQGGVITERRKLKSPEEILNKIPGYYDGKPAPLGFPVEQPPKMVNGMHPDLVDGKKTADRFNRMDPESAKAMPLTGNPHIDKKVKAARKKPK